MDWNRIEGNWKEAKGKIKQKWGQLTDDDLTQINGRRDQLEGKIALRFGQRYGAQRRRRLAGRPAVTRLLRRLFGERIAARAEEELMHFENPRSSKIQEKMS